MVQVQMSELLEGHYLVWFHHPTYFEQCSISHRNQNTEGLPNKSPSLTYESKYARKHKRLQN